MIIWVYVIAIVLFVFEKSGFYVGLAWQMSGNSIEKPFIDK